MAFNNAQFPRRGNPLWLPRADTEVCPYNIKLNSIIKQFGIILEKDLREYFVFQHSHTVFS
jgi:hypothetical protein